MVLLCLEEHSDAFLGGLMIYLNWCCLMGPDNDTLTLALHGLLASLSPPPQQPLVLIIGPQHALL